MLPLLAQQKAIYTFEKLNPNTPTNHHGIAITLKGEVDAHCLAKAIEELQLRHPILNSKIVQDKDQYYFGPSDNNNPPFRIIDTTAKNAPGEREAANILDTKFKNLLYHPFAFDKGPLWRANLIKYTNQSHLVFIFHDVIVDDQSIDIILQELSEIYNAKLENRLPKLSDHNPNLHPESDENYWQNNIKINYWKKNLKDLNIPSLHSDFERSNEFNFKGERCYFKLDAQTIAACKNIANEFKTSIDNVIMSVLFFQLQRHTNENDLCIGLLTNERKQQADLNTTINCFSNSLPIRIDLPDDATFSDLLAKVTASTQRAIANEIPINEIIQSALSDDLKANMSIASPYKVICSFNEVQNTFALKNTKTIDYTDLNLHHSKFEDFGIAFTLQPDGHADAYIEFNSKLYKAETMQRLAQRLTKTLQNLPQNLTTQVSDIPILLDNERKMLNEFLHSKDFKIPNNEFIHQIFSRIAHINPRKAAVVFHDLKDQMRYITYGELDRASNQLAAYLQHLGVGPEKTVGICVNRSLDLIISIFAVLKSGGVIVPLESNEKDEDTLPRIQHKIKDAKLDTILVDNQTKELIQKFDKSILKINVAQKKYLDDVKKLKLTYHKPQLSPHNLAYIIYTSGSTGTPKGVMIEHRNLNNLSYEIKERQLGFLSKVEMLAPDTFDAFFWELLEWQSTKGGELHLINEKERLSPLVQEKIIRKYGINCATLLPAVLANLDPEHLPSLTDVISMGEVPHEDTLKKWYSRGCIIRNEYGPTEATICSTVNPYDPEVPFNSIGKPIRGSQILLLDKNLKQCPIGMIGKIYIGGAGLARGYLGRDDLTEKAFPYVTYDEKTEGYKRSEKTNRKAQRLYDTGDLGYYILGPDNDIRIVFLGRSDRQVKLDGVRIELDGIEAILRAHKKIHDVYLKLNQYKNGLIAYIVPKMNEVITQENLNGYMSTTSIPTVARPQSFVIMKELPLTKNGKVDSKALPQPEIRAKVFQEPKTDLQKKLRQIWEEVLKKSPIDVTHTFRALGGTSINLGVLDFKLQSHLKISSEFGLSMLNRDITILSLENLVKPYLNVVLSSPTVHVKEKKPFLPHSFFGSRRLPVAKKVPASSTENKIKL